MRETATDQDAAERTELACRFWLEGSLTGNPLAQKSLADEVMLEASVSGNADERLLAATLFALASQQDSQEGPSDSLARVIEYDVAAREVQSQEEFLASPVVQAANAALGGLYGLQHETAAALDGDVDELAPLGAVVPADERLLRARAPPRAARCGQSGRRRRSDPPRLAGGHRAHHADQQPRPELGRGRRAEQLRPGARGR